MPWGMHPMGEHMEYEAILEIYNAGDRVFLRSIMDSAGITYFIQGEHVAPYLFHAAPMRLMARKDQAAAARKLLAGCDLSFSFEIPGMRNAG